MACAGCDFNLPKASAKAQTMESKKSVKRFLETVPLTVDEQAIVKGDMQKLDGILRKLENVPALDGRTPREIVSQQTGSYQVLSDEAPEG